MVEKKKKELRYYQIECLNIFESHFLDNDDTRGLFTLACGTGKSFIAFNMILTTIKRNRCKMFVFVTSRRNLVH